MKIDCLLIILAITISSTGVFAQGQFGTKDPALVNLKGSIYYLENTTEKMPEDIAKHKVEGVLYTKALDIPVREFTEGFPGITNRFEWFGIMYTGTFEIDNPGTYKWTLDSDDGSILWIDGKQVIDNDGVHALNEVEAETALSKGLHTMKLWFFQGPATELGLQLFITPPGGEKKIFNLDDYSAGLTNAAKKVNAVATKEGIKIQLPNSILFDVGKYDLKPEATETIALVSDVIKSYPGSKVRIEGHTDNTGKPDANQKLSEDRAKSVMAALQKQNIPADIQLIPTGYGQTKPTASNDTEDGRAQNRRVEVVIIM
jgi:outer membrane protein OmpA-like peptidoglycan-associated protein